MALFKVEQEAMISLLIILQDGSLQPHRKSEPIPVVNNEPVKVVVADSFQDMVFNSRKNGLSNLLSFSSFNH